MIKKILLGLVALLAIVLMVAATKPNVFRIERSITIAAPAAVLFDYVNDAKKFEQWNPWQKLDPNIKNIYSGPPSGVGAACTWSGNADVGEGTSTIIESKPGQLVRQKLEMRKPMESICTTDFTFSSEGDKTKVTWAMYGAQPFIGKVMSLFIDCDKMCGDQFIEGLNQLDRIVTAAPPQK
jgi:uncharacterized protein YndB with AHSA1/START domain